MGRGEFAPANLVQHVSQGGHGEGGMPGQKVGRPMDRLWDSEDETRF